MSDPYMENDPKTLAEARTMLLDAWEAIDKGQQAERRRDELIVQAFSLGASYKDVMSCTGLSRPTVWRIRRRAEKGIPSEEVSWDFTIPGQYSKTDVPQSILEDTLQDGLIGLLDDVAGDDGQLDKDFSSPDLTDERKAIRDAIHDLATRAAVSKSDVVASTALGITLTRHKQKQGSPMVKSNNKTMTDMERMWLIDKKDQYILVCPHRLNFTYPTDELVKYGHGYVRSMGKTEGLLLYDTKSKMYMGFSLGRLEGDQSTLILPCTNGHQYDVTSTGMREGAASVQDGPGTCTVSGCAEKR